MIALVLVGTCWCAPLRAQTAASGSTPVRIAPQWIGPVARVEFDWPNEIAVASQVVGRVLVLRFDRPLTADIAVIRERLRAYVALASLDPDGRTLRLALTRDLRSEVRRAGRRVAVDLLPPDSSVAPPAVEALAPRPVAPRAPAPQVSAPAPVSAAPVVPVQPARVDPPPPVLAVRPVPRPETLARANAADAVDVGLRIGRTPDYTRLSFDWPDPVAYRAEEVPTGLVLRFTTPGRIDLGPLREDPPPFLTDVTPSNTESGLRIEIGTVAGGRTRHLRDGNRVVVDILKPDDVEADPEPQNPAVLDQLEALAQLAEAEQDGATGPADTGSAIPLDPVPVSQDMTGPEIPITVEAVDGQVALRFDWPEPVGMAAFRRGDFVWIVFDRPARFDLAPLDGRYRDVFTGLEQVAQAGAALLRAGVHSKTLVSAERAGPQWTVVFGDEITEPSRPLALNRLLDSDTDGSGALAVPLPGRGTLVRFDDPEVGDRLAVVTLDAAPHGFVTRRRLVDLTVLASAHGVAIDPVAEDLEIAVRDGAARIDRPTGLTMAGPDTRVGASGTGLRDLGPGFMHVAAWARGGTAQFQGNLRTLQDDVRAAEDAAARSAARLDLARFYAANDFMVESLGVMELMAADDADAAQDPAFRALRGYTRLAVARPQDALEDLDHHTLRFDPSAALWRGVALTELGRWAEARAAFEMGGPALPAHDPDQQARFQLARAGAALGVNDLGGAQEAIKRFDRAAAGPRLALQADLVEGRIHEALGAPDKAQGDYARVLASGYLPMQVQAAFRSIMVERRLGVLEADEAIERLERLRFQWRGDDLELQVLRELGKLYVSSGNIRQGLVVMRLAVQSFPGSERARDVADDMAQVFVDLYLEDGADDMTPVQALALFYDFPELVPVGTKGDEMIRRLADRLVAVDLLEQAAELLDHQVKFRLRGVARSQIATRLAMVHLMDRKPAKALQVIHATRQTRLPERLNRQRRLLEARALGELDRHDHALEVIEGYNGTDAQRLRADILWKAEDWPKAAEVLEGLAADLTRKESVEQNDRLQIMRAAIAYALAEDGPGLARLRQRFAGVMSGTPDERAFDIVTQRIETQGVAFRELVGRIAATDTLDAFMAGFGEDAGGRAGG